MKTVQDISKLNWTKRWSGPFRLFLCSYTGEQYYNELKRVHKEGLPHIVFAHKDGVTSCYRERDETNEFGEHLAQMAAKRPAILSEWSQRLKKETDAMKKIIQEPPKSFFNPKNYSRFEKIFNNYLPYASANNTVIDYLPFQLIEKYEKILIDARMYSESTYNEVEYFFRKLTKIIAEKENLPTLHCEDLYYDEFKKYLSEGALPSKAELEERYFWSGLYFDKGKRQMLSAEEIIEFERLIFEKSSGEMHVINGKTASPGIARGVVRIVHHPKRVEIFNDGDILVTGMTRPDFVPFMKRAGAIVTDAGGLLCHAAIVSRELGKPCVIATEVATKVFKDGDIVEVDADTGKIAKI